jgi:exodeoxyribonuclease-3
MLLATWNVNSIRARLERLVSWLGARAPDVVCLQETKCDDARFPFAELAAAGYRAVAHGQKTYNGVAILARVEPRDVSRGLGDGAEDSQRRVIAASFGPLRVVCAYAPNGQAIGSSAYEYKLAWFRRLRHSLEAQSRPGELLAVCGDFNVAPEPRDVYAPGLFENQVLYSAAEREALTHLLGYGLRDAFRLHHGEPGRYSWWDYRMLSFAHNRGLRIDHLLLSAALAERCRACDIDRGARKGKQPSDHAPVWALLDVESSFKI